MDLECFDLDDYLSGSENCDSESCSRPEDLDNSRKETSANLSYSAGTTLNQFPEHFKILTIKETRIIIRAVTQDLKEALNFEDFIVEYLLRRYEWDTQKILEESIPLCQDLEQKVGFYNDLSGGISTENNSDEYFVCPVICEEVPYSETDVLACGHRASLKCWKQYLETSLNNDFPLKMLSKECFFENCHCLIPQSFWQKYLSSCDYIRFVNVAERELINRNPLLRHCIGNNCTRVIQLIQERFDQPIRVPTDVRCECGEAFCFDCGIEPHSPVGCDEANEWITFIHSDKDSAKYLSLFSRNCPKCHARIQKSEGCSAMTCVCGQTFCWNCGQATTHLKSGKLCDESMSEMKTWLMKHYDEYNNFVLLRKRQTEIPLQLSKAKSIDRFLVSLFPKVTPCLEQVVYNMVECERVLRWLNIFCCTYEPQKVKEDEDAMILRLNVLSKQLANMVSDLENKFESLPSDILPLLKEGKETHFLLTWRSELWSKTIKSQNFIKSVKTSFPGEFHTLNIANRLKNILRVGLQEST